METDVLIVGAELDGLVAAIRLLELGRSVDLISAGQGSLNYNSAGLHVLGCIRDRDHSKNLMLPGELDYLPDRHPYRLIGWPHIKAAIDWFIELGGRLGYPFCQPSVDFLELTAIGSSRPIYSPARFQAQWPSVTGIAATIEFSGYIDSLANIVSQGLLKDGVRSEVVVIDHFVGKSTSSIGLARAFDNQNDAENVFEKIKSSLSEETEVVLFPAILGFQNHIATVELAESIIGLQCREIPTLPPSIPGRRLNDILMLEFNRLGGLFHGTSNIVRSIQEGNFVNGLVDANGMTYKFDSLIIASGGILMGGLTVDHLGTVHESILDLRVRQIGPLFGLTSENALAALHTTGVEVDEELRPLKEGEPCLNNVYVVGRTLANWDPSTEGSTEGVSIGTGFCSAEFANRALG